MPGTIHVSVLELVGLPSPPQSSSSSSSMGVKVSMGKQAHEIRDKEETSFPLASLRDNLNVSIQDSQGNEIARTDVETRSIVEKGTWDDLFPLKGGGNIHLKLHFYLTEDEQNRIRSVREIAARKKQEDLLKRSHSSSDLAGASGGSSVSLQDSFKSRERSNLDPSYNQATEISAESNVKALNKAQPGQKKQVFSTSKSTGALDKMPAYHQLKERLDTEKQAQLDTPPSNEEAPATNKSSSTTQLRTMVDLPSKASSLKKTVTINPKPIFPDLETSPSPSLPVQIEKERRQQLPVNDKLKEAAKLTSTQADAPSKPPKETVCISTKPVLSKFKHAPSSSFSEEVRKESGKMLPAANEPKEQVETPAVVPSLKKTVPIKTKPVLSKFKTTPFFATPDEIRKERGNILPATSETRKTVQSSSSTKKEENVSEEKLHTSPLAESAFSLKAVLESLPKRKKLLTDKFKEKRGFNGNDPFLIEKKWRSKHWISYQHISKSKVSHRNKHHSIDTFRGWVFLEEMIYPCLLRDNKPFVDAIEDYISDSSPQLDDQEKIEDDGVSHSKSERGLNESKKSESTRRPNNIPFGAPAGQVMKIAIMVGFGLLVILTRQRK